MLERCDAPSAATTASAVPGAIWPPEQLKIMIVDDEAIFVKILSLHLKKAGYANLASTTESRQALDMLRQYRPDCLLLDLGMPDISGFEILAQLRADPGLGRPRVIVITASCDEDLKAQARALGARAVLSKPVEVSELIWCIHQAMA